MSGTEWFLLVVVVIGLPLLVAVVVTIWTLEMARQRNKKNRPQPATPVKRNATRAPIDESKARPVLDSTADDRSDSGEDESGAGPRDSPWQQ